MNLVKLTRPDGKELYVSPEQICSVELSVSQFNSDGMFFTRIVLTSGEHSVTETVYEVVAMLRRQNAQA